MPSLPVVAQEQWGSRLGVVLAVSGSAVGIGNFLRFPGQAAANGGGGFLIPYFCALIFLGIPICWAEWAMGRYAGRKGFHSAPAILGVIGKGRAWRYAGVLGVVIPLAVSFYYTFIAAWCLGYFYAYSTGSPVVDASMPIADQARASTQFYNDFSGTSENGFIFGSLGVPTIVFWAVTFGLNIFLILRGLSKGIERFVSFAMPLMAVCAVVVLIRVLTLGTPDPSLPDQNVMNGLAYMWNPDFTALGNPQTWLAAAGQIFFSISVGFGIIINYASYVRPKDDVALSGLTAAATNEVFEVGFGIGLPARLRQAGEHHQVQRIGLAIGTAAKIVPEQEHGLPPGNRHAQLHHHPLVRRTAVDHREQPVGVAHVAKVGLSDAGGPAGACPVDLVVAGERLPYLRAGRFQGRHQRRQRPFALLRGEAVRVRQIQGLFLRGHVRAPACLVQRAASARARQPTLLIQRIPKSRGVRLIALAARRPACNLV